VSELAFICWCPSISPAWFSIQTSIVRACRSIPPDA
jgi:hypothetical protein